MSYNLFRNTIDLFINEHIALFASPPVLVIILKIGTPTLVTHTQSPRHSNKLELSLYISFFISSICSMDCMSMSREQRARDKSSD